MTTKPEFTKPFNLQHAKVGAPYGCSGGYEATILKFDARNKTSPLVGILGGDDIVFSWCSDGSYKNPGPRSADLVMLPLGMIDGKPVFLGDQVIGSSGGREPAILSAFVGMSFPEGHGWSWPAPAPVYPETLMDFHQAIEAIDARGARGGLTITEGQIKTVANAAIRHAIDAGQVVTAADHESALAALGDQLKGVAIARDAARDMAVANEVVLAAKKWLKAQAGPGHYLSNGLENAMTYAMPEIIAGVAK